MFAKQYRLKTTNDFKGVFKKGRSVTKEGVLLRVRPTDGDHPRIGIIVSKKVAKKAVVRNRIRRILAEAIRPHLGHIRTNADVVVVVLPDFRAEKTRQVNKIIDALFKQAFLLK